MRRRKAGRPPEGERGMRVRDYRQLSVRLPARVHRQVAELRRALKMTSTKVVVQAIVVMYQAMRNVRAKEEGKWMRTRRRKAAGR